MSGAERVLAVWIPDWPIIAHRQERADCGEEPDPPALALLAQHRVTACSLDARRAGVRTGLREREARMRCPELAVHPHNPEVDARRFTPVLAAIDRVTPGVEAIRPGLCVVRARGPARYYGDEGKAAAAIVSHLTHLGVPEVRVGIADGRFAAEQATRAAPEDPGVRAPAPGVRIVAADATASFLSPLPVSRAANTAFAEVLVGLGISTLGALAALPEEAIRQRFGAPGLAAHRRARGLGAAHAAEVQPHTPPPEFATRVHLEPPLNASDQLAFACSRHADDLHRTLIGHGLVCTELRVELLDDLGVRHERVWAHPTHFTTADIVNRVRWQAATVPQQAGRENAGIAEVRLTPARTAEAARHEPGLWNTAPDERVHHHLSRVQSLVGHDGVGTGELTGGRRLDERQRFVPWGTRPERQQRSRARHGPWPGHLEGELPTTVFTAPLPVELLDRAGIPLTADANDLLSGTPARLRVEGRTIPAGVQAWSAPWPLRERWWAGSGASTRLQVLLADGDAWLLRFEDRGSPGARAWWVAEARYT